HLGESGHEELALGVDALRIGGDSDGCAWAHGSDSSIAHEDGLPRENPLTIHWQDGHVYESGGAGRGRARRVAREKGRDERGEQQHGSSCHERPLLENSAGMIAIPPFVASAPLGRRDARNVHNTTLRHNGAYHYAAPVRRRIGEAHAL